MFFANIGKDGLTIKGDLIIKYNRANTFFKEFIQYINYLDFDSSLEIILDTSISF